MDLLRGVGGDPRELGNILIAGFRQEAEAMGGRRGKEESLRRAVGRGVVFQTGPVSVGSSESKRVLTRVLVRPDGSR